MGVRVEREKWILYKHTNNYEIIKAVALDVKNSCKTDISDVEKYRMQERLAALHLYKTRNPKDKPLDAINHRINTLKYWMFGYEDKVDGKKKFIFSPLGNLFLKYINDNEKTKKIFTAMMYGIQFQHPNSGTSEEFQLYPFRLIFKLLQDERLQSKLYNFEVEYLLFFEKEMSKELYERLVCRILELRLKTNEEIAKLLKEDEHTYVNTVYEWEYYTTTLLEQIGIVRKFSGTEITRLAHPMNKTNDDSNENEEDKKPTYRRATRGYIELSSEIKNFIETMSNQYSLFDKPIDLRDAERLYIDCVKEVYSFYPNVLLEEIGESEELNELLELPKLIEKYSNNPNNETAYLFEKVLSDGFNMFYNVDAKLRGGSGHTDIECLYSIDSIEVSKTKKFAVESKSTANKLMGINAGRLKVHRDEIGGEYTIVITSRYVPATKKDITGTPIVIILASTFAEYLYNHIFNDIREIDFSDFDDIICDNLGKDISGLISNMTLEKFATIN
ncbi:hypothetical protein [uncultured Thomasclavelia sp.]|uniref:hypothetical protein n=1 Tax=uncultured Thomasclavelia sp. TaxID=3025759 RepID=UPI00259642A6|nr:hypothetical protein [uncultured Thomasclavelia sp.]